jgi:DNA-binding CsgD family transcriptional regulator
MTGQIKSRPYQWLLDHVDYDYDACLIWPFSTTRGYGSLNVDGVANYAHRAMCELVNGPAPTDEHQAAHNCGNGHRGCVHPLHLAWKTPSENQLDRRDHGTTARSWSYTGRATPEQVEQIRALKGVKTHDEIARQFGFTRQNISAILAGKTFSRPSKMPPRLKPEQVRQIRQLGYSKTAREIAEVVGTSAAVVDRIRNGKYYQDVI